MNCGNISSRQKMKLITASLLLAGLITTANGVVDDSLVAVNIIFRHGDRAPSHPLPIERYNESFWPYGWGELTDIGKEQHYRLGKFFRKRYGTFLKDKFDYKEIEIRSSDVDRCLVSAYSDLAGLYSNRTIDEDLKLPFIRWQPLPVHTEPVVIDEVLAMNRPCAATDTERSSLFNKPVVKKLNVDYAELFKLIAAKTGLNLTENGFRDMWRSTDTLFCESQHGGLLPDWTSSKNVTCGDNSDIPCANRTVWQVMKEMSDYQFYLMYNSSVMHKFDGGPLLEDIMTKFEEFENGTRSVKFNMYSGHDTTVSAVLSALGVFNNFAPKYASSVMIELHKAVNPLYKYDVKVFYKNVTDSDDVHTLDLPGCPTPCSIESFRNFVDHYKISDWDTECGNNPSPTTVAPAPSAVILTQEEIIVISICGSLVLIMVFAAMICYVTRKRISHSYIPVHT